MTDRLEFTSLEVKPKYFAQKCPVCNGWGTVSFQRVSCHACKGLGYITIPIEEREKEYGKRQE